MVSGTLAVVNARMHTMDPARPKAEAALVENGRISLVGTTQEVLERAGKVETLDCEGRTVVPGFIDGHAHLEMTCLHLTRWLPLHVPPYESLPQIAAAIGERAERTPPGEWIVGRTSMGFSAKVAEKRLFTRQELDDITTEHPVAVLSSLHIAMLNTRALKELGLWEPDAKPPRGIVVHREPSGEPTGIATEIWPMLPGFPKETVKAALREKVMDWFVSKGVTTIHNLPYSAEDIMAVQELQESGELPLRLRFFYHIPHQIQLDELLATGLKPGFGNDMLRYGGIKLFIDGIGNDGLGNVIFDVKWEEDELSEFVERSHVAGQQLWMHALHIDGLRFGIRVVERAIQRHPAPHRHRIEHAGDYAADPEDLRRLREAGIWVVTTPAFLYAAGAARARRRQPHWRSLIDAGFQVIGSSDTTGSIPDGIAPMFNIGCALNYIDDPNERISVEDALRMFTIWAAAGSYEEQDKGSITAGKLGDFAVLSRDPREVEPEELFELPVDATVLGGKVVYTR
jgi:predicted amidohydrolase YtcJ